MHSTFHSMQYVIYNSQCRAYCCCSYTADYYYRVSDVLIWERLLGKFYNRISYYVLFRLFKVEKQVFQNSTVGVTEIWYILETPSYGILLRIVSGRKT